MILKNDKFTGVITRFVNENEFILDDGNKTIICDINVRFPEYKTTIKVGDKITIDGSWYVNHFAFENHMEACLLITAITLHNQVGVAANDY